MKNLILAICGILFLSGCTTVSPLSQDTVSGVRNGQTAVLVYDSSGQINYVEDHFYLLAVTQTASQSVYRGIWDSNKDSSSAIASSLKGLGLNATSSYELLGQQQAEAFTASDAAAYGFQSNLKSAEKVIKTPAVSPDLRETLLQHGQNYLLIAGWSGLQVHIQKLGLPTTETSLISYWLVDLKQNAVVSNGIGGDFEKVSLADNSGKEFYESNELAGLKSESQKQLTVGITSAFSKALGLSDQK